MNRVEVALVTETMRVCDTLFAKTLLRSFEVEERGERCAWHI